MAKKICAWLIVLLVLVAFIPSTSVTVLASSTGSGTLEDPYLIYSQEDLVRINSLGAKQYRLMNDIELSGLWKPLVKFSGTLDGNGFTISGLNVNLQSDNAGLFASLSGAQIKNLTIKGNVTGTTYVGGVAGSAINSTLDNCVSDVKISATYDFAGGLVGIGSGTTIRKCVNVGNVKARYYAGGIIGGIYSSSSSIITMSDCVNKGNIESQDDSGGIAGGTKTGTIAIQCSYNTGNIVSTAVGSSAGGICGGSQSGIYITQCYSAGTIEAKGAAGGIGAHSITKTSVNINTHITGDSVGRITGISVAVTNSLALDSTQMTKGGVLVAATSNANGVDGKSTSLADLKKQSTYEALGWDFTRVWTMGEAGFPVLRFENSAGQNIDSISIAAVDKSIYSKDQLALSYQISPSATSFPSLIWTSSNTAVATVSSSGVVTAHTPGVVTITATAYNGVSASVEVVCEGYPISNMGELSKINTLGSRYFVLTNDIELSGLWKPLGTFGGTLDGNGFTISGLNVNVQGNNAGLFASLSGAKIKNLTIKGSVTGATYVGGIAGSAFDSILDNCVSYVDVTATNEFAGGLVGSGSYIIIRQCVNMSNVKAKSYAGGMTGGISSSTPTEQTITITECVNKGNITSQYSSGGMAGWAKGGTLAIQYCYNTGDILSESYSGGIAGTTGASMYITKCYSAGSVGNSGYASGIATRGVIRNSVSINTHIVGSSNAVNRIGNFSAVESSLALDSTQMTKGGVLVAATSNANGADGKSTSLADLKKQSTYEALGWDFTNVWMMGEAGFPVLRFENSAGQIAVNEVKFEKTEMTIKEGQTVELIATILPANASNKALEWGSENPSIVSVDDRGNIVGASQGTAVITATSVNGISARITITVIPSNDVEEIKINPESLELVVGEKHQLVAEVLPENADNAAVEWESSDLTVATVDENGEITAISEGEAIITARTANGISGECRVVVNARELVTTKINDNDSRIQYSGTWSYYPDTQFYGGDEHYTNQAGAYAELTFNGVAIRLIAATSFNLGKFDVYIDGQLSQSGIDCYSPNLESQKVLLSINDLSDGEHTIRIVACGDKNTNATDAHITIDAFEVDAYSNDEEPIVKATVNDDSIEITYSGTWTYYRDSAFYQGDEHFSNQAGAYIEFSFTGTGIAVIGATSYNLGICDIYIDGVLVCSGLDLYSLSLEAQKVLFEKLDMEETIHTIRIQVTGNQNPSAQAAYVTIDAFKVY